MTMHRFNGSLALGGLSVGFASQTTPANIRMRIVAIAKSQLY
jgi:hypothetical protein